MEDTPRPVDPPRSLDHAPLPPARRAGSASYYVLGPLVAGPAFLASMWTGAALDYSFGWGIFYELSHAVTFSCLLSPLALLGGILAAFFTRRAQPRQRATVLWSLVAGVGAALLAWVVFMSMA